MTAKKRKLVHRGHVALICVALGAVLLVAGIATLVMALNAGNRAATQPADVADAAALVPALTSPRPLPGAQAYEPQDDTLDVEISEYAGYAGLILANGGQLAPTEDSIFFRKYGFRVRLTVSESEDWTPIQTGKLAATTTTADVLAAYDGKLDVVTPLLIARSHGADSIVVRSDIQNVYDLKGKALVVPQFTEADFLIRYLANEVGLKVQTLDSLDVKGFSLDKVNLVFAASVDDAEKILEQALDRSDQRISGALVWAPFDADILQAHGTQARILATTRDVSLVADILIVNKPFAANHPKMVEGLAQGILAGNALAREDPAKAVAAVRHAFDWEEDEARHHLENVQLATPAENVEFFAPDSKHPDGFDSIRRSAYRLYYGDRIGESVNR